ncbi:lipase maturation factor 2 [Indicator indicator]|uniref:lipase maturation factor 2 n=1 Tax=Indicator indicator TaxID=1002788 RepID=UPI0023E0186B|nr:lipase maturation factor 2 [Indicator indicator]
MRVPPVRPRSLFLTGLAAVYLAAFASLYVQIPGLYGRAGILPARKLLRLTGKGFWEQLRDFPTLLWLSPYLGLDTELGMELLCLLGVLMSLGAVLLEPLRDCLLFALLRMCYLSLYQVGQVFLYFQWDSLLLEAGFLAVLVAPLHLLKWKSTSWRPHDGVTFWLVRWLLFRLMFSSGVVKLTSRCPTWWGLTALTYHYQSQCIPTPVAWFAHQLPSWFQKLSVVATYVIEVPIPILFFAPIRRLRLFAFYCQVLLQLLIILTGNYNFFNILTITLAFSLLDQEHLGGSGSPSKKKQSNAWPPSFFSFFSTLLELTTYGFLIYWTTQYFGLEINWEKKLLDSKVAFTYHEFTTWLGTVTLPLVGLGFLSLSWEILLALYRSLSVPGCCWKLWATLQWGIFTCATLGVFAISLVPFTSLDAPSSRQLWPGLRQLFGAVERFQVVSSYGLFRRMTGVGGRPEVVLEGSLDGHSWTEIEFLYKPGNLSRAPPVVAPHQPRLDWQMWFAALDHHSSSPWFTSFVHRLLQGQEDVVALLEGGGSQYPFRARPPRYLRAQLYRYYFTPPGSSGLWWQRQLVGEFYPAVALGDPMLETLLEQLGMKEQTPPRPTPKAALPQLLLFLRQLCQPVPAPVLLWSLYLLLGSALALRALRAPSRPGGGGTAPTRHKGAPRRGGEPGMAGGERNGHRNGQPRRREEEERAEGHGDRQGDGHGDRLRAARRRK